MRWRRSLLLAVWACAVAACGTENTLRSLKFGFTLSPELLDFGAHPSGARPELPLELENTGERPLEVTLALRGDVRRVFDVRPRSLAIGPEQRAQVQVVYLAPVNAGADRATIAVGISDEELRVVVRGTTTLDATGGSCPDGQLACGGRCVDARIDPLHCGNCGAACRAWESCEAGVCGCTPTTCAAQGKNCGSIPDSCGGTLPCGTCPGGTGCGLGGVPNVCG